MKRSGNQRSRSVSNSGHRRSNRSNSRYNDDKLSLFESQLQLLEKDFATKEVYAKISDLETILFQLRGEKNARLAQEDKQNDILLHHNSPYSNHSSFQTTSSTSKTATPTSGESQNGAPAMSNRGRGRAPKRTTSSSGINSKTMNIYERSKIRLAQKDRHLQEIEIEMMENCTFTPETNHTSRNGSIYSRGSSRTRASSLPRLQTRQSLRSTPDLVVHRNDSMRSYQKVSPLSLGSVGSKVDMNRINDLYEDGLRKERPRSTKEESQIRKDLLEQEELEFCTFKPKMDWRKKYLREKKVGKKAGKKVGKNAGNNAEKKERKQKPKEIEVKKSEQEISPVSLDQSMGSLTMDSGEERPPISVITTSRVTPAYITPTKVDAYGFVISALGEITETNYSGEKKNDVRKALEAAFHAVHSPSTVQNDHGSEARHSESMRTEYGSI